MQVIDGPVHPYMDAAPGCWELYCSLEDWKASLAPRDAPTIVQWLVDGYASQHPTNLDRRNRQSVAVHLMSLCASFERGESGVRLRRSLGSWTHREYEALIPHPASYPVTVRDVVRADLDDRPRVVGELARGTWASWVDHHDQVRAWLDAASSAEP